jgi:hypothetical protein
MSDTNEQLLVQTGIAVVAAALTRTDAEAQKTAAPVREGELKTLTRLDTKRSTLSARD